MEAHAGIEPARAAFEAPPPSQRMGRLVPRAGVEPCLSRLKAGAPHRKRNAAKLVGAEGIEPSSLGVGQAFYHSTKRPNWSAWKDSNLRSRAPEARALAWLSYTLMRWRPCAERTARADVRAVGVVPATHGQSVRANDKLPLSPCGRGRGPTPELVEGDGRVRGRPVRSLAPLSPAKLARMNGIEPSCIRGTGGGTPRVRHARNGRGTGNRTRGQPVKSRQLCH
jgi:hypothetical protein